MELIIVLFVLLKLNTTIFVFNLRKDVKKDVKSNSSSYTFVETFKSVFFLPKTDSIIYHTFY